MLLHFYWFGAATPPRGWGWVRLISGGGWGWCGNLLDNVGMMWGWQRQGWRGDHRDNMGWRQWRPQPCRPHGDLVGAMRMMWGQQGWCGDDAGMTGMTWGWRGQCGDNEIIKNTITFERIKIIEFCLKIWDLEPSHTHIWCVGGGCVLSQMALLCKKCSKVN